ncbi:MAG: hypothetical protein WC384_03125 [Prolixibacteraceae bacterium]|jgi:hypothetical protein
MKPLKMLFSVGVILVFTTSCQKDEVASALDEVTLSQQETQADEVLNDIDLLVDEAVDLKSGQLKSATMGGTVYLNDCPVITINTEVSPEVLTIDFGTSCTGDDGKERSGKIIVTSESFTTFPSVREKTFDNFYVDGKKIEGNVLKTITKDQENNIRTAELQENITITFPDGEGTATRVAKLTRQYQRGAVGTRLDNEVVSWGTAEFTRISGVKVTKTVSADNPLVFKISCHHLVSGVVSISTSNNRNWTIDYGDGECDNLATLTIGDKTKEIRIR